MDFRHSVLIYHLPKAYLEDAVKSITELTTISEKSISLMKSDHWGSKIILDNEQNFREVVSLCVLYVHGTAFSLYSLVTDLIVCGTGAQIDALEVELLLERYAPVLIVYEVKNQLDSVTFRAALNYPEIPEIIRLWTGTNLKTSGHDNTEFSISLFCRFCRQTDHSKSQCRKRQVPVVREDCGRPSVLKKNDNDQQDKKDSMSQSDDQQHRKIQNLQFSPHPESQVHPYECPGASQMQQYPLCQSPPKSPSSNAPYTHVTSSLQSLPNCKVSDCQTKAVVSSDSSAGLADSSKESSDSSAVCKNDFDQSKKDTFEATSSKPLSPSTNLKHLIPPTMHNDIETLKLFFSHCKRFKHLYKSALRYPAGIGALLRQLRKILKFNKNIKTKSEEELKFIAWICLLLSKLQYFHMKKNIQLEPFYVPPL